MTLPILNDPVSLADLPGLGEKWQFVGVDLAPVDSLETGLAVIDRNRQLLRMDKVDLDKDIFLFLNNLGPKPGMIIALDIPKSLNFTSKWRQQQIKMHPLRMLGSESDPAGSRFAQRAYDFYQRATNEGFLVVNFFSHYAKMRYGLTVPFRSRSPQGCRAQHAIIKERLKLGQMPGNLAPSSVLDAMIGAYLGWSIYTSHVRLGSPRFKKFTPPFHLYRDAELRLFADPQGLMSGR